MKTSLRMMSCSRDSTVAGSTGDRVTVVSVKALKVVSRTDPPEEAGGEEVEWGEGRGGCVWVSEASLIGVEVDVVLEPILR